MVLYSNGLIALKLKIIFHTSVIKCVNVPFLAMNGSILAMNVFRGGFLNTKGTKDNTKVTKVFCD